jgi:hypothetical protein
MENEWVELLITNNEIEAAMIKDLLESGGISVKMRSARVRPYPVSIGRMSEIKILVRKSDLEAAKEFLKQE